MKTKFLILLLLISFSCNDFNKFSAGSYPYAEVFEITLPKENVIHKIDSIKVNEKLQVPQFEWAGKETLLKDKALKNGYFVFYIFLKESNQIIYCYLRETDLNNTKIGLISVQNGLSLGNWKEFNKDLSHEETAHIKEIFKEKVISKIKSQ
jgi:hypothetical protein